MIRNRAYLIAVAILSSMVPAHAQSETAMAQIDAIVQSIKAGSVGSVEVFGVPPDTLFRTNVPPERLESLWDYKLTVRGLDGRLEPRAKELTVALKSAATQPSLTKLDSLDVRWGIIFYAKTPEGKRIASLYFDRNGRSGAVNNTPVSFAPDLLPRLKKALHASID
jgi:hypothetical protein